MAAASVGIDSIHSRDRTAEAMDVRIAWERDMNPVVYLHSYHKSIDFGWRHVSRLEVIGRWFAEEGHAVETRGHSITCS